MPYQQYIKKNTSYIVTHINSLNYKTIGIHSWSKTGYSRGKIYKYVIDELENKEKDKSIFEFVVTMQNHLPYIYQEDNGVQYVDNIYLNKSNLMKIEFNIQYFANVEFNIKMKGIKLK